MTNFEGFADRECGEHRTTGTRAWCHDCTEWCYEGIPCRGCELPQLRHAIDLLRNAVNAYMAVPEDDDEAEAYAYNALVDVMRRTAE